MKFNTLVDTLLTEAKGKKKPKDEDGNEFSGALAKARKEGKPTMVVGGKKIPVKKKAK